MIHLIILLYICIIMYSILCQYDKIVQRCTTYCLMYFCAASCCVIWCHIIPGPFKSLVIVPLLCLKGIASHTRRSAKQRVSRDFDFSGLPCEENSRCNPKRRFLNGRFSNLYAVWAKRHKHDETPLIGLENVFIYAILKMF